MKQGSQADGAVIATEQYVDDNAGGASEQYVDDAIAAIAAAGIVSGPLDSLSLNDPAMQAYLVGKLIEGTGIDVSVNGDGDLVFSVSGLTKSSVGLGNVDNTADASKPVSTAQQSALDAKAPLASPTFTGTVAGVTKAHVGLGSVDNTADADKPVSTAAQTALNLKANLASPTFTGTVSGVSKSMVGLGSVDNTADTAKPVSTAQQSALDLKANESARTKALVASGAGTTVNLTTSDQSIFTAGTPSITATTGDVVTVTLGVRAKQNAGGARVLTAKVKVAGTTTVLTLSPSSLADSATDIKGSVTVVITVLGSSSYAVTGVWQHANRVAPASDYGTGTDAIGSGVSFDVTVATASTGGTQEVQLMSTAITRVRA